MMHIIPYRHRRMASLVVTVWILSLAALSPLLGWAAPVSNPPEPTGVLLHLRLDEPTGATTFVDSSGHQHHGTCGGESCPTIRPTGEGGTAATFDGDERITIANHPSLELTNGTLMAWVRPDWPCETLRTNPTILAMRDQAYTRYSIHINQICNELIMWNGEHGMLAAYSFQRGKWYHIAMTEEYGLLTMYVNGVQIKQGFFRFTPQSGLPLSIGQSGHRPLGSGNEGGAEPFIGNIKDVRIYDSVLSDSEIATLYDRTR